MKIGFFGFGAFNCALAHYLTKKFKDDDTYSFFFWDIDNDIYENFNKNKNILTIFKKWSLTIRFRVVKIKRT